MNLTSVLKAILLVLILLGLMACVLPSQASWGRLGGSGPFNRLLIGHSVERVGSDHVIRAS